MSSALTRRHFIMGLGAVAAASALPAKTLADGLEPPPCRTTDLSHPVKPGPAGIIFGYAAITWNGEDEQAIREISELGFRGIQLRSNILKDYADRPGALRELLDQYHLRMVALSSGNVGIAAGTEAEEIAKHVGNARFVREVGGQYLQVTDSARPRDRQPASTDFKQLGKLLSELGKRTSDLGIPLGYHNHMSSLGESPAEVDHIMEETDQRYVKLELDIAHYQQGGGNPAQAIRQYHDRLLFLHIKDVETLTPSERGQRSYRFVELGRGRVDLPAVFTALKKARFRGWAVVELDSVPDPSRTPKESALISKKYLEDNLKMKV